MDRGRGAGTGVNDDRVTLKSGREFYPNRRIVGISLNAGDNCVYGGYDQHEFVSDENQPPSGLTHGERMELALMMSNRWLAWGKG
jgi:hypothetical protein